METTLASDKGTIQAELKQTKETLDFYLLLVEQLLWPTSIKKAEKASAARDKVLKLFDKLEKYFTDKRGATYSKPATIRRQVKDLMALLPEDERASLLQELQEENNHANTTTLPR